MINLAELGRVFIVCGKTDMRRGIDSLAYIVRTSFHLDLFSGHLLLTKKVRGNIILTDKRRVRQSNFELLT